MSEIQPNAENHYEVTKADLPLHCPMDGMSLWNSHPKVFLPIEKTGKAKCPYCGADYTLTDFQPPAGQKDEQKGETTGE
jgi:uncharacterized Zn-finger protein